MKTISLIIGLGLITLSCKAQVIPLDGDESFKPNSNYYYKDTNNTFNAFQGQWKWENITTSSSITFILEKKESLDSGANFTHDIIIGEYQYIQDGDILADTFENLNNPDFSGYLHSISGTLILSKWVSPQCLDCEEGERRIQLSIKHDQYQGVYGKLIMRHFVENDIEKLHVIIRDGAWLSPDPTAPADIDIPFGEYIMVKQ